MMDRIAPRNSDGTRRGWQEARDFIDFALPVISLIPGIWVLASSTDDNVSKLNLAIFSIIIYQLIFLIVLLLTLYYARVFEKKLDGYRKSDAIFRDVATSRATFLQNSTNLQLKKGANRESKIESLDGYVQDFLEGICNKTADVIAIRSGNPRAKLSVNIKSFEFDEGSRDQIYFVAAASSWYGDERARSGKKNSGSYFVSKNYCFQWVIQNPGQAFVCNDMQSYILKNQSSDMPEPRADALRYYKKCIMVPIMTHRNRSSNQRANGNEDEESSLLSGMIIIDTHDDNFEFDNNRYVGILSEMAINIDSIWSHKKLLLEILK